MDVGRASLLIKTPSFAEEFCGGETSVFSNWLVMAREHKEKAKQAKKRTVKLKWLIKNIPKEGTRAREILGDNKK